MFVDLRKRENGLVLATLQSADVAVVDSGLIPNFMASERSVTVQYSLNIQQGINAPVSSQTNQPIPAKNTLTFDAGDQKPFDYKKVIAAIQQAKIVTGQDTLTPWRDAVGDKEKGKDAKTIKSSKSKTDLDQEELDEEEEGDDEEVA